MTDRGSFRQERGEKATRRLQNGTSEESAMRGPRSQQNGENAERGNRGRQRGESGERGPRSHRGEANVENTDAPESVDAPANPEVSEVEVVVESAVSE
jgi:hypothetical protein